MVTREALCKAVQWSLQTGFLCVVLIAALFCRSVLPVQAQIDPFDPNYGADTGEVEEENRDDSTKSADDLILEGKILLDDERLIEARTKLLSALARDPKKYEAHILLSGYYMMHVGHFRLALRYARRAEQLFLEQAGPPPYSDRRRAAEHAQIIYLLSQIKLNLDDYEGSLQLLDEFSSHTYYSSWYPGSRSWVLMKLGRLDEAIKVARLGVLVGAEPGRTLNMLGILLSMKGEREASLQIFREAIEFELSQGRDGQPATPLNNSGEVYKEIFEEEKAENAWLRSTSMPDGCEHVLPSLNLTLLYIEQLKLNAAWETLNRFESCVAQFPLRNGEEHRSLVNLARGRILLLQGQIDPALEKLERALEERQWFGKIGTDQNDMLAGSLISLSQALQYKNNHLANLPTHSLADAVRNMRDRISNAIRARWLMRRARQVLTEDLSFFEDLYIRNTDSLIEYPTLGEVLKGLPLRTVQRRIESERELDDRGPAQTYYKAYQAEALIHHGDTQAGLSLLTEALRNCRSKYDDYLRLHLLIVKLATLDSDTVEYRKLANEVFDLSHAALRNYGFTLPLNYAAIDPRAVDIFRSIGITLSNEEELSYRVEHEENNGKHTFRLRSTQGMGGAVTVEGDNFEDVAERFALSIFTD